MESGERRVHVFLDQPFKDTGLSFITRFLRTRTRFALADRYQDGQIAITKLAKFAEAVGAQTGLEIVDSKLLPQP